MSRTARASVGGMWYHALNRGNRREDVFHTPDDYDAFVTALGDACARVAVDVLGYCLMPNHFHLLLRPHHDGDLGRFAQRLLTAHARRYHRQQGTTGHVWQGRFKAFPVADDEHLVTALRYVEANPVRAGLVTSAGLWTWSSLAGWRRGEAWLWRGAEPIRDARWPRRVNRPLPPRDLQRVRQSVSRGRPFGDDDWTHETAARLGLESSLRPPGRPRKNAT